jgi:hypothetical protein
MVADQLFAVMLPSRHIQTRRQPHEHAWEWAGAWRRNNAQGPILTAVALRPVCWQRRLPAQSLSEVG